MVDPVSFSQNVYKVGKVFLLAVFVLNLTGYAFADTTFVTALETLCGQARSILFVGAMLLIVVGAAVYAVGQILGAETRARASVWATAMFVGAIIGILIYILVPQFLQTVAPEGNFLTHCTGAVAED